MVEISPGEPGFFSFSVPYSISNSKLYPLKNMLDEKPWERILTTQNFWGGDNFGSHPNLYLHLD
jgi:hypothetical protein